MWQALLSFHQSARHAHPHLFSSLSGQDGNQGSPLAFRPLYYRSPCTVLYVSLTNEKTEKGNGLQSIKIDCRCIFPQGMHCNLPVIGAGIFKQSMGARNRVGIVLSYRPAGLHRHLLHLHCHDKEKQSLCLNTKERETIKKSLTASLSMRQWSVRTYEKEWGGKETQKNNDNKKYDSTLQNKWNF